MLALTAVALLLHCASVNAVIITVPDGEYCYQEFFTAGDPDNFYTLVVNPPSPTGLPRATNVTVMGRAHKARLNVTYNRGLSLATISGIVDPLSNHTRATSSDSLIQDFLDADALPSAVTGPQHWEFVIVYAENLNATGSQPLYVVQSIVLNHTAGGGLHTPKVFSRDSCDCFRNTTYTNSSVSPDMMRDRLALSAFTTTTAPPTASILSS